MGLLSTELGPQGRPGGDPRVQQAGKQGAVGEHQESVHQELWLVGWSASQAQQLTRYIPVANLLFTSDMR